MEPHMAAEEAALQLFDLYADRVYEFAKYQLNNEADAEDVVQETFVRVLRYWHKVDNPSNPRLWLWTIARNCVMDVHRRRSRRKERSLPDAEVLHGGVVAGDSLLEVEDLIRRLPEPQRRVVYLRLLEDFSTEQTATILGWSSGKVRATLHRAVKKLRATLSDEQEKSAADAKRRRKS